MSTELLEDWAQQAHFLERSVTPAKLAGAIRGYSHIHCDLSRRVDAFRTGNHSVFENEISSDADPIVARIAYWQTRVDDYLRGGRRAFVAIGVTHLLGPYGLVARLESEGYQVRRL